MRGQRAKLLWVAPDCRHTSGSRSCEGETSGVRPGGAVRQDALEGGADTVRTVQDVFGEQPQRRVTALQSRHIAAAILLVNRPGAVELLAVALDDEPSIDQQVDTTHTLDTNLEFDTAAELTQKKANQRLGPRFGARVQQRAQDVESTGDACEDLADVRFIDEPEVPGVIERGDRRPWRLASDRLRERFDDVDGGTVPWRRRRTPVVDDVAGCRRPAACQRVLLHVAVRVVVDEHSAQGQEGDAVQSPAQTRRCDDVVMRAGRDEPPLPHARQDTVCDGAGESTPRPPGSVKFVGRPHDLLVLIAPGIEERHPLTLVGPIAAPGRRGPELWMTGAGEERVAQASPVQNS